MMGAAFRCDACDGLEGGSPAQTVTVKPAMGHSEALDLCSACLVSHNDWRVSRAPDSDKPEASTSVDVPFQGGGS